MYSLICFTDIDECTESLHNCSSYAFCNNTEGSYNCTCKPGYTGNGRECRFDGNLLLKENLIIISFVIKNKSAVALSSISFNFHRNYDVQGSSREKDVSK